MRRQLLALMILFGCGISAKAETMPLITLKDPFIAQQQAKELLFGGQKAKDYLELMPDGTHRRIPKEFEKDVDYAVWNTNFGSWMTLTSYAVPILFALYAPDPWKNFSNQNETSLMRGLVALPVIMTYFQWGTNRDIVGPFFKNITIQMNKAELAKVSTPSLTP